MRSRVVSSLLSVLPTSQVFTSGYVNMETILHFFYKITNERGTKTMFTYTHVKWFYGQSKCTHYLNNFIKNNRQRHNKKLPDLWKRPHAILKWYHLVYMMKAHPHRCSLHFFCGSQRTTPCHQFVFLKRKGCHFLS